YQGFRGFGALTDEPAAVSRPPKLESPEPELLKPELPKPESSAQKPSAGDAAALLSLLQRQHPTAAPIASIPGAGNAPALAIISALAALLQPKPPAGEPKSEPRPAAKPAVPPPAPSSGAEIVVLRRHANAATYVAARDSDSVALTSQERDAFKEIARALGANVR